MAMDPPHAAGRRFGDYSILRLIARGGMGVVYEAQHLRFGNHVALKLIDKPSHDEDVMTRRFLREGRTLDAIRHPNIVRVFEVGFENGCPFIAMELIRGETLRERIDRLGSLSKHELFDLFVPICDAVATLHGAGILHRDLKLANVMLSERTGRCEPMLLDFGIAKDVATGHDETVLTHSEGILGTPRYLSPEQALNPKAASPLSDQYAVGVMLYECIAGRPPFSAEGPYGLMHAILNAAVEPPSRFSGQREGELDNLVLRAMHREPSSRFPDVRSLGHALAALRPAEPREPATRRSGHPDPAFDRTEHDWSRSTPASARVRATAAGLGPGRGFLRDSRSAPPSSSRTNPPSAPSGAPSSSRVARPSTDNDSVESTVPSRLTTGPFYEVTALDARIIRVRRTPREFSTAAEVAAEQLRVGLALDRLGRAQKRLLVDSRHAPHGTDERLADAFLALRHEIGRGFERTAVLVASKVGILQATRLNKKMSLGGAVATFDSEREALEFLRK